MKKQLLTIALCLPLMLSLAGCGGQRAYTVGQSIPDGAITEFYYTYENINFYASYLRYHFYREDGKPLFSFERRERPNDYGPTTAEDVVAAGTVGLSEAAWSEFLASLRGGTVTKRTDDAASGGAGPWLYLNCTGDRSDWQVFSFPSVEKRAAFEAFCASLEAEADAES
ncbi:MAG: hypothetical protein II557_04595 [Clostridia bacterium]|nr:hypothetical protein [Clostridia bacterium]